MNLRRKTFPAFLFPIALAEMTLFFSLKSNFDGDLFWHMASRWIIDNMSIPKVDSFSFVYLGAAWIDIPWIFQVATYFADRAFGYFGVLLFCAGINILSVVILWKTFKACLEPDANSQIQEWIGFSVFSGARGCRLKKS
jgi:hypothetical protein